MTGNEKNVQRIVREMRKHVGGKAVVWHDDPFRVLMATVLSQRTKDQNTRKAAESLFSKYKTPEEIAGAPLRDLERLVKPSGFYKVKARRIRDISRQIASDFHGKVPRKREDLLRLEGVGPKTAGCVQVYGFNDYALPVDTHVHRISNRLGLVKTRTPEETEPRLKEAIPKRHWREINLLMVRFGQLVCVPGNPRCGICGLRDICGYYRNVVRAKEQDNC
jgi:endonuclease-3